jgi:hypothetical protein
MELSEKEIVKLQILEEDLWRSEVRFSKEKMNSILDEDFMEIGSSGKIYNKQDTINVTFREINAQLPLAQFSIKLLAASVILINYRSVQYSIEGIKKEALRSSIWIKKNNSWKIVFHQGTPLH